MKFTFNLVILEADEPAKQLGLQLIIDIDIVRHFFCTSPTTAIICVLRPALQPSFGRRTLPRVCRAPILARANAVYESKNSRWAERLILMVWRQAVAGSSPSPWMVCQLWVRAPPLTRSPRFESPQRSCFFFLVTSTISPPSQPW